MVVRKLQALPVEAVVRGYLIGSGWKDYQRTGEVCGIALPAGLRLADQLPRADLHAVDQGANAATTTRTSASTRSSRLIGHDLARRRCAIRRSRCTSSPRRMRWRAASSSRTRSSSSASTPRRRPADADRRGTDTGLVALLAGRHVQPGHEPAVVRQAVRARLSRDARLEQDGARRRTLPRGRHPAHQRKVREALRAA